jgi:hypothetical protein
MSSISSRDAATGKFKELPLLSWPLRQDPIRAVCILLLLLAVACHATFVTSSWLVGILVMLSLLASVWRIWLPVHFEIGPRGVTQRIGNYRRRIPWGEIAGYQLRHRGVLLLADNRQGPLAPFRSLFLRYPAQPDQLRHLLELHLANQLGSPTQLGPGAAEDVTVITPPPSSPDRGPEA